MYGFLRFFLKKERSSTIGIFVGKSLYKCQDTKRVACTFEWQHIMGDPWKRKYKQNSLDPKLKKNLTYTKAMQLQLKTKSLYPNVINTQLGPNHLLSSL